MSKRTWPMLPLLAALLWSAATMVGEGTPVLVELFTSEGCSSCPPADALLTTLIATQPVDGAQVIALEEHVDYWNNLGWRDPWSSAQFSRRQRSYAVALGHGAVYTPQMVVDGEIGFIGSDAVSAKRVLAAAAGQPSATVTLVRAGPNQGNAIALKIGIEGVPASFRGRSAELWLALTEDGLESRVAHGENIGRLLHHGAVVRRLSPVKILTLGKRRQTVSAAVSVDPHWRHGNLRVVAFVQLRPTRRIVGAASLSVGEEHHGQHARVHESAK